MNDEFSRRSFVKGAAASLAPAVLPALGANDKANIGWIGTGSRGMYVMDMMYRASPELGVVTYVCDAFQGAINNAKDQVVTKGKNTPKTTNDYREVLKDSSIDTVFITTPEHLHHEMAIAALRAGKHIYLEKPLAHTIEEGWDILREAEKAGKVVQVGTQNRSNSLYIKARDLVKQGMIGNVHYVRAFWYRNSLTDPWRYAVQEGLSEKTADWDKFLGPAKKRPFDARRYRQWRLYWDYSGGISTDLLVHQTDITNFVLDKTVPLSCMASGGIYRWADPNDDREVPDTLSALYEYPDRFHINYSCYFGNDHYGYGEQFMGDEGTIEVLNRQTLNFYPETFRGRPPEHVKARKELTETIPNNDNNAVQAHVKNFLEAVLGRGQVIAPATIGQQAAISGHMATLSFKNQKKIVWDSRTNKYRFV